MAPRMDRMKQILGYDWLPERGKMNTCCAVQREKYWRFLFGFPYSCIKDVRVSETFVLRVFLPVCVHLNWRKEPLLFIHAFASIHLQSRKPQLPL